MDTAKHTSNIYTNCGMHVHDGRVMSFGKVAGCGTRGFGYARWRGREDARTQGCTDAWMQDAGHEINAVVVEIEAGRRPDMRHLLICSV
uniref:HDC16899 n=1 Tax=Drosophila melanogaster TaxID=7227 RepID=Q6IIV2_DROME|nr:TPA_inf: HDC16899 [Drosophila melanogaster]